MATERSRAAASPPVGVWGPLLRDDPGPKTGLSTGSRVMKFSSRKVGKRRREHPSVKRSVLSLFPREAVEIKTIRFSSSLNGLLGVKCVVSNYKQTQRTRVVT